MDAIRFLSFPVANTLAHAINKKSVYTDKERELHEAKAYERKASVEKDECEHSLQRYRDDGQLMVDNERRRLEREMQFKKAHEDCVEKYDATVKSQVPSHSTPTRLLLLILTLVSED